MLGGMWTGTATSRERAAHRVSGWRPRDHFDLAVIGATHGLSDGFSNLLGPSFEIIRRGM